MSGPADLFAALAGVPLLDGAACLGRWEMFDPAERDEDAEDREYRHGTAIRLCRTCPVLADCQSWFESLDPTERPAGVVAGQVHQFHTTRRPRKKTAA